MAKHRRRPPSLLISLLAVTLLLCSGDIALAQPARLAKVVEDESLLRYVNPDRLVDIGGRRIHLRCEGQGTPAVILLSGLGSWSPVWYKTQPAIANRTRVCAWDRAAYGFSDPAPQPQILSNTVKDLRAALTAADVAGPYVLVGHSLGGLEARLFAQQWPQEVVGMVLVDTSPAAEFLRFPGLAEIEKTEENLSTQLECALLAADGPLESSNPDYEKCSLPLPNETPGGLRKIWPSFFTAEYAMAKVTLLLSLFTHRYDSADHLHFGDKPLVVLSSDIGWNLQGPVGEFWRRYRKRWFAQHEALAHLSARGVHRVIEHSQHEIQLDKPRAVIDAVDEVLRQLRAGANP